MQAARNGAEDLSGPAEDGGEARSPGVVPSSAGSLAPILAVNFVGSLGFSIVLPFLVYVVTRLGGNALVCLLGVGLRRGLRPDVPERARPAGQVPPAARRPDS